MADPAPTQTALAAKALMERIDNPTYQRVIKTRAHLGGWVGARGAGLWDVGTSDAVAEAAVEAVLELFRAWAAECDEQQEEDGAAWLTRHQSLPSARPPTWHGGVSTSTATDTTTKRG